MAQKDLSEPEAPPPDRHCEFFSGVGQLLRTKGYAVVPLIFHPVQAQLLRRVCCRGSGSGKLWLCKHQAECMQECMGLVEELCDAEDPEDHQSFVEGWWGTSSAVTHARGKC